MSSAKEKAKIVIASVLKPVDDVRNCEKLAHSLSKNTDHQITICGTKGSNESTPNIEFHAWRKFKRLGLDRLCVQLQFLDLCRKSKPSLLIITTHELLIVAVLVRCLWRSKIIYDVQEDYFKNLWFQTFYPPVLRHLAALIIRTIEFLSSPFIAHFFLAEKMYENDLRFIHKRHSVLDNKSNPIDKKPSEIFKVVFTGTISDYSKALESLQLFKQIQEAIPTAEMVVIGYAPNKGYRHRIREQFYDLAKLKINDSPVAHSEIVDEISSAHLAIVGYETNPVNERKIPTKLYEYISAEIPYLVRPNTYWGEIGTELGGAIAVDFENPDIEQIKDAIEQAKTMGFQRDLAHWDRNEAVLLRTVNEILVYN